MNDKNDETPIARTLKNLESAFSQWDSVLGSETSSTPIDPESDEQKIKKKAQELLQKLSEQIKSLDL